MPTPFITSEAPKRPAAPPPRDEGSREITFKWQSETATITVPDGSTPARCRVEAMTSRTTRVDDDSSTRVEAQPVAFVSANFERNRRATRPR